jgi:hypothetical protein
VLVDLPLGEAPVDDAVACLTAVGFRFGALLPEYAAGGDVLRLQRPAALPAGVELATPDARSLLDYTLADGA